MKSKNLLRVQNLPDNATTTEVEQAKKLDKFELALVKKEFSAGRFSVLKQFKDLLIQNYDMHTPIVYISTGITEFEVHTNKWKQAGTKVQ